MDVETANADFNTFKLDSFLRAKQYAAKKVSLLYEFTEVEAALLSWGEVDESLKEKISSYSPSTDSSEFENNVIG